MSPSTLNKSKLSYFSICSRPTSQHTGPTNLKTNPSVHEYSLGPIFATVPYISIVEEEVGAPRDVGLQPVHHSYK